MVLDEIHLTGPDPAGMRRHSLKAMGGGVGNFPPSCAAECAVRAAGMQDKRRPSAALTPFASKGTRSSTF
jgi:hypothetical protein